jgi:predicted RNA-binding Zn ribbon-like protein
MELTLGSVALSAERQPGGRAPAPGDLGVVQALVNSFYDLDNHGGDLLATPESLGRWLRKWDLIETGADLAPADVRRAVDVREGLRALLFINNGAEADRGAISRMNEALRGSGLWVRLEPDGRPDFRAPAGLDGALGLMAAIVAAAQLEGRWTRLKACPGDHCGWAFYDHSRNMASSWCSMSVCGSRTKAREYRRRQRGGDQ